MAACAWRILRDAAQTRGSSGWRPVWDAQFRKLQNAAVSIAKISHAALRHGEFIVGSRNPFKGK
jgi:hypothetical protein